MFVVHLHIDYKKNNTTKSDRNNLPSTVNLNIVNTSSSNLVTIFTSFSSTKREILYNNNSAHNQFTSFSNYLPSSILPDHQPHHRPDPPKVWRHKAANKYRQCCVLLVQRILSIN